MFCECAHEMKKSFIEEAMIKSIEEVIEEEKSQENNNEEGVSNEENKDEPKENWLLNMCFISLIYQKLLFGQLVKSVYYANKINKDRIH